MTNKNRNSSIQSTTICPKSYFFKLLFTAAFSGKNVQDDEKMKMFPFIQIADYAKWFSVWIIY